MKFATNLALAGTLLVLATSASASDPTGTWYSTVTLHGQVMETSLRFYLDSEGPTLTGSERDPSGSAVRPISKATFNGRRIRFVIDHQYNGEKAAINYVGTVAGDTITGLATFEFGDRSSAAQWVARRQK